MRAGSWKLTPYQAWLEGLLQALSLSLGAAFSFHEHCLDRWNHLHLRIPTPWVSKDMNWCHRNNWGFGEPCFVWEAPNESSSRLMVGSVVPRKDFAIPISTQPSHDSNSTLYMRLANQPRFKINFLKIAWNKKTCATSREMVESWDPNSKTHRKKEKPPTRCQLSWCQMMFY